MEIDSTQLTFEPSNSDYDKVKNINPFDIAGENNDNLGILNNWRIGASNAGVRFDVIKRLLAIDYSPGLLDRGTYELREDYNLCRHDLDYTYRAIAKKTAMSKKERKAEEASEMHIFTLKGHRDSRNRLKKEIKMFERGDWLALGSNYLKNACMFYRRSEGLSNIDQETEVGLLNDSILNLLEARVCVERALKKSPKLKQKVDQMST